jgi:hypothetical protein
MGLALTLYGYARDPSVPDGGAEASVPQQRPAAEPADEGSPYIPVDPSESSPSSLSSDESWTSTSGAAWSGEAAVDPDVGSADAGASWTASGLWRVSPEDTGDHRSTAHGYDPGRSDGAGFNPVRRDPPSFDPFRTGEPSGDRSAPGGFDAFRPDPEGHFAMDPEPPGWGGPRSDPAGFDAFRPATGTGYPAPPEPFGYDAARSDPRGFDVGRSDPHGFDASRSDPRGFDVGRSDPRGFDAGRSDPSGAPVGRLDPGGVEPERPDTGWADGAGSAATGATVGGTAFIGFGPVDVSATGAGRAAPGVSGRSASGGGADQAHQAAVAWASQAEIAGLDTPEIPPWDRRPLMVVLAAGAVLILVAILAGAITSQLFKPDPAGWQPPGPRPSAGNPGPAPTTGSLAPPVGGDTVTLAGVGDVIMGTEPNKVPPANGDGFFDPVKESLAADLVMGNLETALTVDTGRAKCPVGSTGCFQFYLPPAYAGHLRDAGFSLMNLANNHTNDMGPQGLTNTRQALEAAGVQHTGAPNEITYVDVKGVKVAVLGFAVYSWGQNLNNIPAAVKLVEKAAAKADLVVIQMQGGAEGADKDHVLPGHEMYLGEDRGDLIAFSHAVIDAGADVVFGHGPHVMRGMEFYKGRLIAYSLGNFCGYGVLNSAGYLGVGGVLKVTLHRDGSWAAGQLIATEMVKGGMVALDPAKRALAFVDGLSKADFGSAGAVVAAVDGSVVARTTA